MYLYYQHLLQSYFGKQNPNRKCSKRRATVPPLNYTRRYNSGKTDRIYMYIIRMVQRFRLKSIYYTPTHALHPHAVLHSPRVTRAPALSSTHVRVRPPVPLYLRSLPRSMFPGRRIFRVPRPQLVGITSSAWFYYTALQMLLLVITEGSSAFRRPRGG